MSFTAVAYPWNRNSILTSAPDKPGVYAIWNKQVWIYIGETQDIQRRLLEHFDNTEACIHQSGPAVWGYELFQSEQFRIQRQRALIRELLPACNRTSG
jgi:predicted GIY-YIG superfamily endonuclease